MYVHINTYVSSTSTHTHTHTHSDKLYLIPNLNYIHVYLRTYIMHHETLCSTYMYRCCGGKDEEDFRPLFDNFVQDLLTTLNLPEWPASEVLLTLLGVLLVCIPSLSVCLSVCLSVSLSLSLNIDIETTCRLC